MTAPLSCEGCSTIKVAHEAYVMRLDVGSGHVHPAARGETDLPSPEQPLDVGELEFDIGRAAVVALAGAVASMWRSSACIPSGVSDRPEGAEWRQAKVPRKASNRRAIFCAPSSASRSAARSRASPTRSPRADRRRLREALRV